MARPGQQSDLWRTTRRIVLGVVCVFCIALFLLWRIDNPRVERFRMAIIDQVVPPMDWLNRRILSVTRMVQDFESYARVYEQNQQLRDELQQMRVWYEAAVQLEQENARLRELNNVRLSPRLTYVTGEVLSDSGSPFRQSSLVNIGRRDGVVEGAAAMDGLGLVGRVTGLASSTARVMFLTDSSSRVAAVIRPSGQRAIVAGNNSSTPPLDFIENEEQVEPGDRVVTSGEGGILPPDLLIGQVVRAPDGRLFVLPAADYRRLRYIRILRPQPKETIIQTETLLGPRLTSPEPVN